MPPSLGAKGHAMGEDMTGRVRKRFEEALATIRLTDEHLAGRVVQAAGLIIEAHRSGGGVLLFGNGGSAADAQHIAGELVGRFQRERRALRAVALTTDSSVLTSIANDYDFRRVFARQIEGLARPGDVAVGLSTSGNSPSVVEGLAAARRMGLKTVAFTGAGGGKCAALADVLLDVPARPAARVQEAHAVLYHVLCELVEDAAAEAE